MADNNKFDTYDFLLKAYQVGGVGLSYLGAKQVNKMNAFSTRLNQSALDLTMQEEQLASLQEGLQNIKNLREVISSQNAIMAARGQMSGVGSAKAIEQASVREFEDSEHARNLSMVFREGALKRERRLMEIGRLGKKAELAGNLSKDTLQKVSINAMLGDIGIGPKSPDKKKTKGNKLLDY